MTVLSTTSRISYATNGSTMGPFTVPFYFLTNADLVVQSTIAGFTRTLILNTDYTILGAGDPSGGSVTTIGALATGTITIYLDPPIIQTAAYQDHGRFPAKSHEKALDRLTMIAQWLSQRMDDLITLFTSGSVSTDLSAGSLLFAVSGGLSGGVFALDRWVPAAPDNSYRLLLNHARAAVSLEPMLLDYMQASASASPPGLGMTLSAAQAKLAQLLAAALLNPQ